MFSAQFRTAEAVRIPISPQAMARLHALDGEDFDPVIRVAEKKLRQVGFPVALSAVEAEVGLRQYYAMPIIFESQKEMAVSSLVDPYWHAHLLDTRSYRSFCDRVYGQFMDHVPMDDDDSRDVARVTELYLKTRSMMDTAFGEAVSEKVFPKVPTREIVICTYEYEAPARAR